MSRFETIIEQEKEISYSQGNKELFSSHILILIEQERAARRFKRKMFISLLLGLGGVSFLLSLAVSRSWLVFVDSLALNMILLNGQLKKQI